MDVVAIIPYEVAFNNSIKDNKAMTKIILLLFMVSMVIISGCVSITEETPSDVVEQFVNFQKMGNFEECYNLMSEDYQNDHDFEAFMDQIEINKETLNIYELFEVVNETEVIVGEYSIVRIHIIEQSNIPAFFESGSNGSGLNQDFLETREIE